MDTETTPATATPAAAPKSLSGGIDPHVLNAHVLAASKDDSRKSLKGINFKVRSGALHIASTDGRILMHTEIRDGAFWNGPADFDVIVEARKIPCGARDALSHFTIEGDQFKITTSKGISIIPLIKDQVYPNYEQCEIAWECGAYPEYWAQFDPKKLEDVRQYIGEAEYVNSDCLRTSGEVDPETGKTRAKAGCAHAWRVEEGAFRRTVTLMPLRSR